ncbi:MAG: hypothetical protein NDJ92_16235 [Thermoanaerobaculia bacterium]|nr:hypothetical protein [Thermoanaerobaculia bacterium]
MTDPSVDQLRQQLRDLGYLTHGIERWFALDPWSSRTFWAELLAVSAKASLLSSIFAALPLLAITILRNRPLALADALVIGGIQAAGAFASLLLLIVLVAFGLRRNPALAIDSPALLTGLTLLFSGGLSLALVVWWSGFDGAPTTAELAVGGALIVVFFLASSVVVSAALLSFSIHEAKRVPAVHRKDRTMPMTIVAILIACAIGAWSFTAAAPARSAKPPASIPVLQGDSKVALIAVDGLTHDILATRKDAAATLGTIAATPPLAGSLSAAERWATVGTGTASSLHGVHAIEGVRLATSGRVLQSVSRYAFAIDAIAAPLGIASRVPLPPTARRRAYAWEILAERGVPSLAVNWWVTGDTDTTGLRSISQEALFSRMAEQMPGKSPAELAIAIDGEAIRRADAEIAKRSPRFATIFLPALDIVLNRIELDAGARLAASSAIVDGIVAAVTSLHARGYEVILVGLPGEGQSGDAVVATTLAASGEQPRIAGVAPTVLHLAGFPVASDMQGKPFAGPEGVRTIASYGDRGGAASDAQTSEEYYESLRSLGYIR